MTNSSARLDDQDVGRIVTIMTLDMRRARRSLTEAK